MTERSDGSLNGTGLYKQQRHLFGKSFYEAGHPVTFRNIHQQDYPLKRNH